VASSLGFIERTVAESRPPQVIIDDPEDDDAEDDEISGEDFQSAARAVLTRAEAMLHEGLVLRDETTRLMEERFERLEHLMQGCQEAARQAQATSADAQQAASMALEKGREIEAAAAETRAAEARGREILNRLESDYQMLTRLVQELHSHAAAILSLAGPALANTEPAEDATVDDGMQAPMPYDETGPAPAGNDPFGANLAA
jgi:hypothetical protein